jgi:DNA polymerase III gamma/tau subunit
VTVQAVLQLLGAVEEEALFRIGDLIVDGDTAGLLLFVEELADQGQDLNRLVHDLLEHLRHLLLVQHMGEVPDSLPVTDETRERLRSQANQLGEPTVLRLIDLLALAVEDARQGGDPRLPLELALVKVTRPQADLSRESLAHRVELLESRPHAAGPAAVEDVLARAVATPAPSPSQPQREEPPTAETPSLELEQVADAWQRSVVETVRERSIPVASLLAEATPTELAGDTLTLAFPAGADFHRRQIAEPQNIGLLRDALYEVTGRKLAVVLETGDAELAADADDDEPLSEEGVISLLKDTFDAREVEAEEET